MFVAAASLGAYLLRWKLTHCAFAFSVHRAHPFFEWKKKNRQCWAHFYPISISISLYFYYIMLCSCRLSRRDDFHLWCKSVHSARNGFVLSYCLNLYREMHWTNTRLSLFKMNLLLIAFFVLQRHVSRTHSMQAKKKENTSWQINRISHEIETMEMINLHG